MPNCLFLFTASRRIHIYPREHQKTNTPIHNRRCHLLAPHPFTPTNTVNAGPSHPSHSRHHEHKKPEVRGKIPASARGCLTNGPMPDQGSNTPRQTRPNPLSGPHPKYKHIFCHTTCSATRTRRPGYQQRDKTCSHSTGTPATRSGRLRCKLSQPASRGRHGHVSK